MLQTVIDYCLHLDTNLGIFIQNMGAWSYLAIFLTTFAETGIVLAPMLPGDSLLFATGLLAGRGDLQILILLPVYLIAAIGGYGFNYWVGNKFGVWFIEKHGARFIKKEYLVRTQAFFVKRGRKTILIARFVPIVRTFAPFVAGWVGMNRRHFFIYNILGGILWVLTLVGGGYFFGMIPIIRDHFTFVVFSILFLCLWPILIELLRKKQAQK